MGLLVALGTAFTFALFCVLIKHAVFPVSTGMFLFNLFGLIFLLGLLPFYPMQWKPEAPEVWLLLYLGAFPTALAFIFWNRALRMIPTGRSSNCALMVPDSVAGMHRADTSRAYLHHAGDRHGDHCSARCF